VKTPRLLSLIFASGALAGGLRAEANAGAGWKTDMQAELAAWHATPVAIDLSQFQGELPLGVRVDLALRPNTGIKFRVSPGRAPKPDSFGGTPSFQVPADGFYRISAGAPVWIDVVDSATGANVKAHTFEMQAKSDLRKYIVFPLRKGVRYLLQVSGSKSAAASILITPDNIKKL